MDSIGRRFRAGAAAFIWLIISLVIPVSAHAVTYNASQTLSGKYYVLPYGGTSQILASAATMLGRANPWVAAITLGTPVMQFLIEKNGGDRLAIRATDAPVATPPGWTTNPNGIPTPPSTTSPIGGSSPSPVVNPNPSKEEWFCTGYQCSAPMKDATAACVANAAGRGWGAHAVTLEYALYPGQSYCYNPQWGPADNRGFVMSVTQLCPDGSSGSTCPATYSCPSGSVASGTGASTTCSVSPTCPTGYSMSQGYCTVIDPWSVKWPADGIPTLQPAPDGTGFVPDPRDPDTVPANPTSTEIQNPSKDYHQDQYGNPTSTSIQPQPGGGYKIDQRVQTTNNNQTTTTINNITINNLGSVTNISSTTVPGPIESASPTATPASPNIQFPTDYNRENTQLAVKSKLDEIQAGTGAADAPNYDVAAKAQAMNDDLKAKTDAIPGEYQADKGHWFSWVWTPPVGSCSPWVSTVHGQSVTWDVCPYVDKIRDAIGYMLAVVSAIAVYGQLFRRED